MSPLPLRERIPAALALQPMTKWQLAQCLSCTYSGVDRITRQMRLSHRIRVVALEKRGKHRPGLVWGLA